MANDPEQLSGAEEYVAVEIQLSERLDPEQETNLRDALEKIDAVSFDSCDIAPEKISFCYDPTRTNQKALLGAIKQAGGKLKQVESSGSPILSPETGPSQPAS